MERTEERLLEALRCALREACVPWQQLSEEELLSLIRLAEAQGVLPLTTQAIYKSEACRAHPALRASLRELAREQTLR